MRDYQSAQEVFERNHEMDPYRLEHLGEHPPSIPLCFSLSVSLSLRDLTLLRYVFQHSLCEREASRAIASRSHLCQGQALTIG
jgi:hypothetical protein